MVPNTDRSSHSSTHRELIPRYLVPGSAACSVTLGGLAIAGWLLGLPVLTSFGADRIPMAPSTALIFIALGAVVLGRSMRPAAEWGIRAGTAVGTGVLSLSLLLLLLSSLRIYSAAEHLGIAIEGLMRGVPIGHMSPLTATCFALNALSLLMLQRVGVASRKRAAAAFALSGLALLASVSLLLAYLLGEPLLYDTGIIPPALTTSLAFLTLSVSLVGRSFTLELPGRGPYDASDSRLLRTLVLIFALLSAGIISTGYLLFKKQQRLFRLNVERELGAIADLKVREISHWREERIGDSAIFMNNPHFADLVRIVLERPDDEAALRMLMGWLQSARATHGYFSAALVDKEGNRIAAVPDGSPARSCSDLVRLAVDSVRQRRLEFGELHRGSDDIPIHLVLAVPVGGSSLTGEAVAALAFCLDPRIYLYPLVQAWPTSSATAETLLTRREGNHALFLNELRFKRDAAMKLRIPITETRNPAVRAVLGEEGILDGIDYKGTRVIAAMRAIPGSSWRLVARMDVSEAYGPLLERFWLTILLVCSLLAGAGASVGFIWRHQRSRFYSERYRAAEALRASELRFGTTMDHMLEGIQMVGRDWRYVYLNEAVLRQAGRSGEQLLGQSMTEAFPGIEKTVMFGALKRCMEEGLPDRMDNEFVYPDGRRAWFELSIQPVPEGILVLSAEITGRKRAEEHIERLNRVLHAVRRVNQLIVREQSSDQLIADACRSLVEYRSYAAATILLVAEDGRVVSYAEAGRGEEFEPLARELEQGRLPPCCKQASETDEFVVIPKHSALCNPCPIHQTCTATDVLCIRMIHSGTVLGYLCLAVEQGMIDDPEERALFTETASDLALALHTIKMERAREKAEHDRSRLEAQLRQSMKMDAIGRLAGGVAHDFNNMLAVIGGRVEMILREVDPGDPMHPDLVEIQKAAARSADLTRQLLAFARKQTIAPKVLDLSVAINGMLKMLTRIIGEDVELRWNPGPEPALVKIDPSQLDQVLANLLVNARDAIDGVGHVSIETGAVKIDETFCALRPGFLPGRYVSLIVGDDGCGMDKDTLSRIFEPFFTTKQDGMGTGLGLATVYGIVKQNGGMIEAYSELGTGTTFSIYLPPHEGEAPRPLDRAVRVALRTGTETVLLVEDERATLEMLKRLLERLGYSVLAADSPGRALEIASSYNRPIHLLMTDVVMPGMSGKDLWQLLSQSHAGMKCLFISGYTSDMITQRGILDDAAHFLHKPFSVEAVAEKIREVLEG